MKGFLRSKLIMTLVAVVMIAAAIAVPLSSSITHSHAAGTSEPHHALLPSTVTNHVDPTTGLTKTVVTTDASCNSPTVVISSLHKGDQVSIVAVETTTDSNEASQKEFLQLQDTTSPPTFTQQVTVFNEITPLVFNVTASSDELTACILPGADGPDGDEQGLITYTIAHTKTITVHGNLSSIGNEVKKTILEELKTLPVGVDCALDFAEDTPVVYLIKADYTLVKLDIQLATTANPDEQNIEILDALVGLTPKLPPGIGCYQSIISYLSPKTSDTCLVQGGASIGACLLDIKKLILHDK